jgi:hypothetical protein
MNVLYIILTPSFIPHICWIRKFIYDTQIRTIDPQ